jgi:hypothetical protein
MRLVRTLAVLLLAAAVGAGPGYAADGEADSDTRILVTFADPGMSNAARAGPVRPGYSRRSSSYLVSLSVKRAANRIARDFGLHLVDDWPIVPLKVYCQIYGVSDHDVGELLDRLRARPEVESAQLLNRFEVSGTPEVIGIDPYVKLQHNLDELELGQAHLWSRGDGATVTVIDTGADIHHPDLEGRIRSHHDFADRGSEFAADAHGTAVAGLISAAAGNGVGIVGVAPAASVDVLKACWYVGDRPPAVCDTFTLAKALSHAVESATDVINLSLGGPPDPLLARLLGVAFDRGIIVVAAAPDGRQPGFPADVEGVIVVAQRNGTEFAPLSAPGDEILVPVPGGGFDYASGSSLSAAHVSGIVALLVARRTDITRDAVFSLLVDSSTGLEGSVNACRALASLLDLSGCRDSAAAALLAP